MVLAWTIPFDLFCKFLLNMAMRQWENFHNPNIRKPFILGFYLCCSSSLSAPIHASGKKRPESALAQDFQLILQIESSGQGAGGKARIS